MYQVLILSVSRYFGANQGRTIGIYPELKHSAAVNKVLQSRNASKRFEDFALDELKRLGYDSHDSPCYLQSFEISSLEYVKSTGSDLKLVFLTLNNLTDAHWQRLDKIQLAGIGPWLDGLVMPGCWDQLGRGKYRCGEPTDFIEVAHSRGLKVHGFTFRNEWTKLYWDHGQDPYAHFEEYYGLNIDGFFTDFPLTARFDIVLSCLNHHH